MRFAVFAAALSVFLLSACSQGMHYYRENNDVVSFYLNEPEAKEVLFASSLDQYQPHPAEKDKNGTWQVGITAHRSFRYFYLVDNRIMVPECPLSEEDDFGSRNCLYVSSRQ